jgi:hypothetical protein
MIVDGNLDFVVRVAESDEDMDKLLLLVNFVLASARRSFDGLSEAKQRPQSSSPQELWVATSSTFFDTRIAACMLEFSPM